MYAPVQDIRFRGGYSSTIRAPNIAELFGPQSIAFFRPIDPCEEAQISVGPNPANRLANCRADGIPAGFVDPLTARFEGTEGGNPNLSEESSISFTGGIVLTPRWLPGLSVTADYWDIRIEDAIAFPTAQNIVDNCYDAPSLDNQFCALFTRNRNSNSATFLGFESLNRSLLNFAAFESSGVDFDVRYTFDVTDLGLPDWGNIRLGAIGTWLRDLTEFQDASDPTTADPADGELQSPVWAVNGSVSWNYRWLTVSWFSFFQTSQTLGVVELETVGNFTPALTGSSWTHDISVQADITESLGLSAGVNNLLDRNPYLGEFARPVNGIGRAFFVRLSFTQ